MTGCLFGRKGLALMALVDVDTGEYLIEGGYLWKKDFNFKGKLSKYCLYDMEFSLMH